MKTFRFIMLALIFCALFGGCFSSNSNDTIIEVNGKSLRAGGFLSQWTSALGIPKTARQSDGGPTFFYWPKHGIGVFCHPLYDGQFRNIKRGNWTVTSVFIPTKKAVIPHSFPVTETIIFDTLLNVKESVVDQWGLKRFMQ